MSNGAVDLVKWIEIGLQLKVDNPLIYELMTGDIDAVELDALLHEIEDLETRANPGGFTKKAWKGERIRLKGVAFEALGGLVLQSVKPFENYANVLTTTNEIDWLVTMGPLALYSPVLKDWGTHCLCECKVGAETVNVTWIGKLNTALTTNGARVGILLSKKGFGARSSNVRAQLQLLAATPPHRIIICIDLAEMRAALANRTFVQLIGRRYIEVQLGAKPLQAIVQTPPAAPPP
jgi:hypothetical protein